MHEWPEPHQHHHHTPYGSNILIAGDERYQNVHTVSHKLRAAKSSLCKIAIITQYAIKYLCLIRTSHSRITSSVFTLNARFLSGCSLLLFVICVCECVCVVEQHTHTMVIILTSWCAASLYYLSMNRKSQWNRCDNKHALLSSIVWADRFKPIRWNEFALFNSIFAFRWFSA